MGEPTGYQCRICEGDMVPEHGGDSSDSRWMECISCGNTEQLNLMLQERLVDSPMRRERDALRAEVAALKGADSHCLCRADVYQLENQIEHLTSELERWKARMTDEQALAAAVALDEGVPCVKRIDAAIRAVREAGVN